jgi:hypothetical protein
MKGLISGALILLVRATAALAACPTPNPNISAPPFVDGYPLPASGLNNLATSINNLSTILATKVTGTSSGAVGSLSLWSGTQTIVSALDTHGTNVVGIDQKPGYFGAPLMIVGQGNGGQNTFVGEVTNNLPPTLSFPTGVSGAGFEASQGNQVFGLYGLGELRSTTGGTAVAAELTARNFSGGGVDMNLPPNFAIGTTSNNTVGLNVTCGTEVGTRDCTIGLNMGNESGLYADPLFNTDIFLSLFRKYGMFIAAQPTGNHTDIVIQDNGLGTNLQLQSTANYTPGQATILQYNPSNVVTFSLRQNGDIYTVGHFEPAPLARPVVSSCGSGAALNLHATDQSGIVTAGSGTVTSCVITFAQTFNNIPACVITAEASSPMTVYQITSKSNSTFTVGNSANFAGSNFDYICIDEN